MIFGALVTSDLLLKKNDISQHDHMYDSPMMGRSVFMSEDNRFSCNELWTQGRVSPGTLSKLIANTTVVISCIFYTLPNRHRRTSNDLLSKTNKCKYSQNRPRINTQITVGTHHMPPSWLRRQWLTRRSNLGYQSPRFERDWRWRHRCWEFPEDVFALRPLERV